MKHTELIGLLRQALSSAEQGDTEMLDRCLGELFSEQEARIADALGTAERGMELVAVARDAHKAEQELASLADHDERIISETEQRLWNEARKVPGGYHYMGVCSDQLCFYLRDGGELRLAFCDADVDEDEPGDGRMHIDHYGGELPPMITGPAFKTGEEE